MVERHWPTKRNAVFESESLRLTVYRQSFRLGDLRLTTSNFIFQLITCGYSPYVTSSLTRGCVCRLQLLLGLASASSGTSPTGPTRKLYCLRFETPPTGRASSPYLYPPGTGWLGYTHSHWVSAGFEALTAVVMKSSIFWDITPCNPLKFCSLCRLHSRWFLACLILRSWRWRRSVPPKRLLNFNGVLFQKI
jgi:hypothetical protein